MLNLVHIQNGQAVTSSRTIAEIFEKYHKDVLEQIREILAAENSAARFFTESHFMNRGKFYPEYLMNRDGFVLLAMGFTGRKALHFKMAYIDAFNAMEEQLMNARNDQFVGLGEDEIKILRAVKFAEELSKTLLWLAKSESAAKKLAVECAARHFNLNIELFSFMLSNATDSEVFNVTEIGRILKIEANDVNRILRKMKFQRLFRRKWIPIGKGLDFAVFDVYTKWKASVIELIRSFLAERLDE